MQVESGWILSSLSPSFSTQACSNRAFSECRDRTWRSTTSRTRSKEVSWPDDSLLDSSTPRPAASTKVFLPPPGEDPLVDDQNEHDINSVAGVLKLYFRGLENPLFPKERFQDFISTMSESPGRRVVTVASEGERGGGEEAEGGGHLAFGWKTLDLARQGRRGRRRSTWKQSRLEGSPRGKV